MTVKITLPASLIGSVGRQTIGSLGSSEDSTNGSLKKPTFSERHPKVVRSMTVVAYIFSVSLAALLLSAYYVVLWNPSPKDPPRKSSNSGNNNSTTMPCLGLLADGRAIEVVQVQRTSSSRYTQSAHKVKPKPPIVEVVVPKDPVLPEPSKLVSVLQNTSQSDSSLEQQEQEEQLETSALDFGRGIKQETDSVSSSTTSPSTPSSIIIQRILGSKKQGGRVR